MPVRKSITLLTLLLSVSAAPFVAADVAGGFVAGAALPPTICDLSNVRATSPPREPASRILINSGTAPWPARRRRPSRVGASSTGRSTAGSIALSWLFDHIGQMRPWATKRSRISSLSSIRCAEKIKRTPMEDAYDRRRLLALWPSNHYHRCLGMILTYRRYQRTFNSVLTLASLSVEIVVSS
jgi:hypothetical protein